MTGINYITLEQAIDIHAKTVKYSGGGTLGHFDLGRLDSVLQNIQNDDYYPTFVDKLSTENRRFSRVQPLPLRFLQGFRHHPL